MTFATPLPPMSSFSKQNWVIPPPNPSKVFSDSPLLGSQLRLIPPFVLLKIKWSPPGRNNDRSLVHFMNRIAPFDFEHAKDHLILLANPEVMGWNNRCLSLKSLLMSSISLTIIITLCKRLLILVHKEFLHWCVKFKLCFACLLKVLTRLLISCM